MSVRHRREKRNQKLLCADFIKRRHNDRDPFRLANVLASMDDEQKPFFFSLFFRLSSSTFILNRTG